MSEEREGEGGFWIVRMSINETCKPNENEMKRCESEQVVIMRRFSPA